MDEYTKPVWLQRAYLTKATQKKIQLSQYNLKFYNPWCYTVNYGFELVLLVLPIKKVVKFMIFKRNKVQYVPPYGAPCLFFF